MLLASYQSQDIEIEVFCQRFRVREHCWFFVSKSNNVAMVDMRLHREALKIGKTGHSLQQIFFYATDIEE